ncbi:MAG: hypothetical protein L3J80_01815, partial [Thermoplasmata archaeon]|nr:hypothetical protein [Thermoplasmata archaeon]
MRRGGGSGDPGPTRHPTATVEVEVPKLSSFPQSRDQLEYSSRSLVFASDGERVLRVWGAPGRSWVLAVQPNGPTWTATAYG